MVAVAAYLKRRKSRHSQLLSKSLLPSQTTYFFYSWFMKYILEYFKYLRNLRYCRSHQFSKIFTLCPNRFNKICRMLCYLKFTGFHLNRNLKFFPIKIHIVPLNFQRRSLSVKQRRVTNQGRGDTAHFTGALVGFRTGTVL